MANCCDTTYKITGTSEAMESLSEALTILGGGSYTELSKLADYFGIDWKAKHISVRGSIYHKSLSDNVITICTDTAWTGCHDLFRAINKALGNELSISWREIEPGCEVFNVHDEGRFFPEECYVTACGGPFDEAEDCYDSVYDAIETWCSLMKVERAGRSDDEMEAFIEDFEYETDDTCFNIHRFDFEN